MCTPFEAIVLSFPKKNIFLKKKSGNPGQDTQNRNNGRVRRQEAPPFSNSKMSWMKFQAQRLLALRRHVTHLMMGSDMERQLRIEGDDVSCENDKGRRRTRALDASTTEAAPGGLISHHTTDRKNEHRHKYKHNSLQRARRTVCVRISTANQEKTTNTQYERTEIDHQHISLHRKKTLRNRAVNLFRTCVTQRTTEKKSG